MATNLLEQFTKIIRGQDALINYCTRQLLTYPELEVMDLVQEVITAYIEAGYPDTDKNRFALLVLKRVLYHYKKRLDTDSIEDMTEIELHAALKRARSHQNKKRIPKYGVLDDIDIDVLIGTITRQEAADELGIPYDTYQKRLYRKIQKILDK